MYGLPESINLEFFCGKTLVQVCFGGHDLILNFQDDVRVTVTSSLGCLNSGGNNRKYVDFREAAPAVLALLNQTVLSAKGDEAGTLLLRFEGGGTLSIYDDSREYESYSINNGGQKIIV